jgi:hypothetical protein
LQEPADLTATSDDEQSSGQEEEDVANPHQALVPAGNHRSVSAGFQCRFLKS